MKCFWCACSISVGFVMEITAALSFLNHFQDLCNYTWAIVHFCDQAFSLLSFNTALAPFLVPQCYLIREYRQSLLQESRSKSKWCHLSVVGTVTSLPQSPCCQN